MEYPARNPRELTIGEVAALCGSKNHNQPVPATIDFDGALETALVEVFKSLPPAAAGELVKYISKGVEEGPTEEGAMNPVFQDALQTTVEPSDD